MITSTNMKVNSQENLFREITSEEASYISGGWLSLDDVKDGANLVKEGVRDYATGFSDGYSGNEREKDDFNSIVGHIHGTTSKYLFDLVPKVKIKTA